MNAVPIFKPLNEPVRAKIIELPTIIRTSKQDESIEHNKEESVSNRCNKVAGVSSEVYPFISEQEIKSMVDMFNKHIDEAVDGNKKQIASRNKMLFLIGINLGIRASDLCGLTYKFFLKEDGTFKDYYSFQPKKTKKSGKFVKLYFNDTVKKAVADYMADYPIENMDEYLFKSRKGDSHITEIHLGKIIKDTAKEVGIERNICSHSLRKTFGYFVYHNANDKDNALIILQTIFNHSSPSITSKYIGLTDDEVSDVFNSLDLGLDYI